MADPMVLPQRQRPRWKSLLILVIPHLFSLGVMWIVFWIFIDPGVRTILGATKLSLCAASGPLFLVTAKLTGQSDARYDIVGPAVGLFALVAWTVIVLLIPALRRRGSVLTLVVS